MNYFHEPPSTSAFIKSPLLLFTSSFFQWERIDVDKWDLVGRESAIEQKTQFYSLQGEYKDATITPCQRKQNQHARLLR